MTVQTDTIPRMGNITGIAEMLNMISDRIRAFGEHRGLSVAEEDKIFGEFMRVFTSYASWSNPNRWHLDHLDTDKSFGILLVGDYTCLVMLRTDGKVSGHS